MALQFSQVGSYTNQRPSSPKLLPDGCYIDVLAIWTVRNDLIIKGIQPSVETVQGIFRKEMKTLTFDLWIQNML